QLFPLLVSLSLHDALPISFMMSHVEKARIRGAELTGSLTVAGFDLSAQLSHTDPRNRTDGSAQFDNWLARRAQDTARLDIDRRLDRKSTRLNSSHVKISYA